MLSAYINHGVLGVQTFVVAQCDPQAPLALFRSYNSESNTFGEAVTETCCFNVYEVNIGIAPLH